MVNLSRYPLAQLHSTSRTLDVMVRVLSSPVDYARLAQRRRRHHLRRRRLLIFR